MLQALPSAADEYGRSQRSTNRKTVRSVLRSWRRMTPDFEVSYSRIAAQLFDTVVQGQREMAREAADYIPAVLDETGQVRAADAIARVSTAPLIGVAGDGRALDSLLYQAIIRAKTRVGEGETARQALRGSGEWLSKAVGTVLSDTGRAAERLEVAVRPISTYVRMLNPPSCSRCVLLAGKVYRSSTAFLRHPGCDCRHIPSPESVDGDLLVSPRGYFDSLNAADQDRIFTKAGAEAIRAGADIAQVVNARRGASGLAPAARLTADEKRAISSGRLTPTRVFGRDIFVTTEGTTRRGLAGQRLIARGARLQGETAETVSRLSRSGAVQRRVTRQRVQIPRLMPESIQQLATSKEDYLRLLRLNGYIL
ncbi:hypothetical protein [Amycolatopsis kentuckyensis]|uniref:hypothetical protein n=1 Tax=Amycolatopsis kentuckyensis TaxID=218823 RepID=UPI003563B242